MIGNSQRDVGHVYNDEPALPGVAALRLREARGVFVRRPIVACAYAIEW